MSFQMAGYMNDHEKVRQATVVLMLGYTYSRVVERYVGEVVF